MNRKEIFKKEVEAGATITKIKIYTNSLRLVLVEDIKNAPTIIPAIV